MTDQRIIPERSWRTFQDPRIKIVKNAENLGLTKSLNKGIQMARGKYIARMDADDISYPHRFETQLKFLENNKDYALVGSSYYQMNERGEMEVSNRGTDRRCPYSRRPSSTKLVWARQCDDAERCD